MLEGLNIETCQCEKDETTYTCEDNGLLDITFSDTFKEWPDLSTSLQSLKVLIHPFDHEKRCRLRSGTVFLSSGSQASASILKPGDMQDEISLPMWFSSLGESSNATRMSKAWLWSFIPSKASALEDVAKAKLLPRLQALLESTKCNLKEARLDAFSIRVDPQRLETGIIVRFVLTGGKLACSSNTSAQIQDLGPGQNMLKSPVSADIRFSKEPGFHQHVNLSVTPTGVSDEFLVVTQVLPRGAFADPFEINRISFGHNAIVRVLGKPDLEVSSIFSAARPNVIVILVPTNMRSHISVPFHLRYQPVHVNKDDKPEPWTIVDLPEPSASLLSPHERNGDIDFEMYRVLQVLGFNHTHHIQPVLVSRIDTPSYRVPIGDARDGPFLEVATLIVILIGIILVVRSVLNHSIHASRYYKLE